MRYGIQEKITLIAVSKYSTQQDIQEAYQAGVKDFGENKVQDLVKKKTALDSILNIAQKPIIQNHQESKIAWHFIGRLQINKINMLINTQPTMLHSLHSIELANILQKKLEKHKAILQALLQINSANETSKQGFSPEQTIESYLQIQQQCPNIKLCGLMCIGAHTQDRLEINLIAKSFHITRNLFDRLQQHGAKVLSMGMSNDYKIAIAEGSNCLRIGSQIFKASD
ncbi:YggS family pyridoxal phosphate-dependent enzyme [Helicobacter aurati]|uniref:Pyridoxal phosphate homeostasis protein n=1 Tax=Helicobacter aurati TaxID=137778 RepID=A0A3D8J182_9HELI|nr:YggS family pyridoxal phosphate-dependent enzyme [Helicobacter aurati]RDU71282.1 YggS family pyridoxal phosphate-dependent enzyme [Helicobacter aurati]